MSLSFRMQFNALTLQDLMEFDLEKSVGAIL